MGKVKGRGGESGGGGDREEGRSCLEHGEQVKV